jgi:hypothetical protein
MGKNYEESRHDVFKRYYLLISMVWLRKTTGIVSQDNICWRVIGKNKMEGMMLPNLQPQ